jgi:FtsP/CotA-like multicopper oxidase with cupredoxin domain
MQPVAKLDPPPDPKAHQRWDDFPPRKFYETWEREIVWQYHVQGPYAKGSLSWGFAGSQSDHAVTPGPIYHARYGEPILVRRHNDLPPVGQSKVTWALPSTTSHPQDWIDPGEFWDHHYANYPSGGDPREKLASLWYHDHRLDFTAANVYAGLAGFYNLFDEQDTGNENDPSPTAWRLPSGKYDIPMLIHDVLFDSAGEVVFNPFNTAGILGDMVTVNRKIRPFLTVERRKYRIRLYNGGPSRFYQIFLRRGDKGPDQPMTIVTGDGNFQPEPVLAESVYLSPAQRVDLILDFSRYKPGETIHFVNRLEQTNGQGPTGRVVDQGDAFLQFRVVEATGPDPSRVPDFFRPLPEVDMGLVRTQRTFEFDYDGGLWTINGKVFDPNRIDAGIEQGSAEIWTFRNMGNDWSHPIHSHFTEYILLEVNGRPVRRNDIEEGPRQLTETYGVRNRRPLRVFMGGPRRDVATLLPGDEMKIYMRWNDFLGKHVMHCHNVVHEDHSMMIRWDIVPPGQGFAGPRKASDVYPAHLELRPRATSFQEDQAKED